MEPATGQARVNACESSSIDCVSRNHGAATQQGCRPINGKPVHDPIGEAIENFEKAIRGWRK
jgi:hypothetical protein